MPPPGRLAEELRAGGGRSKREDGRLEMGENDEEEHPTSNI
jgi:hypothetical protein